MTAETIEGDPRPVPANLGSLAAALAKAQTKFAPVTRDKTVTVKTKTGGSYTFSYAPLDSILSAVRGPLAENGLVLMQMLDDGALVTTLLHESGAAISGRIDLPNTTDIQSLGSAITYLRRYAAQALLGIAAEEDDDGNRAAGNRATPKGGDDERPEKSSVVQAEGGLIGIASLGKVNAVDGELRETPSGMSVGFVLGEGREKLQVVAYGVLAKVLHPLIPEIIGKRVQVFGPVEADTMRVANRDVPFQRVTLERIVTTEWTLPAPEPVQPEPPTVPMFDDADESALAKAGV